MKRRKLLQLLASVLATGTLPAAINGSRSPLTARDYYAQTFGEPAAAALLGRRYLEKHPATTNTLMKQAGLTTMTDQTESVATFAQQRRQDFLAGDVIKLNGWVLARAECALCALVALS